MARGSRLVMISHLAATANDAYCRQPLRFTDGECYMRPRVGAATWPRDASTHSGTHLDTLDRQVGSPPSRTAPYVPPYRITPAYDNNDARCNIGSTCSGVESTVSFHRPTLFRLYSDAHFSPFLPTSLDLIFFHFSRFYCRRESNSPLIVYP